MSHYHRRFSSYRRLGSQSPNENQAINQIDPNDGGNDFDADGDAITYQCFYDQNIDATVLTASACSGLSGLSFTGGTGVLNWTPSYSQSGTYEFRIIADEGDLTDEQIFSITVTDVNRAPSLAPIGDQTVAPDNAISTIDANDGGNDADADWDVITYLCYYDVTINGAVATTNACSLLTGISFTGSTGVMTWTPTGTQVGSYEFKIVASDTLLSDSEIFSVSVSNLNNFTSMSLGNFHGCGLVNGDVYCMGSDGGGRLGDGGTDTDKDLPTLVDESEFGSLNFTQISTGSDHTCGLTSDSTLYCWGSGTNNELGLGTGINQDTPKPVVMTNLGGAKFVSVDGGDRHTCGLANNSKAYCWGNNSSGEIGNNTTGGNVPIPTEVDDAILGASYFVTVHAGNGSSCGIDSNGLVYCWGRNNSGQLGQNDGFTTSAVDRLTPVAVDMSLLAGGTFLSISMKGKTVCGLASNDNVYCWGEDGDNTIFEKGMLGDNLFIQNRDTLVLVDDVSLAGAKFLTIDVSDKVSCGFADDDSIYCWGYDAYGTLGDAIGSNNSGIPVQVDNAPLGGSKFVSVHVGTNHVCGITDNSQTYCWGTDIYGRLGNGPVDTANHYIPTLVDTSGLGNGSNLCPQNYVEVPSLTGYTAANFCLMKYEARAKRDSDNVIHSWGCDDDSDSTTGDGLCAGASGTISSGGPPPPSTWNFLSILMLFLLPLVVHNYLAQRPNT